MHPVRITAVLSALRLGGAERQLCLLAGELAATGHAVTLLPRRSLAAPEIPIPAGVHLAQAPESAGRDCAWHAPLCLLARRGAWRAAILETRPDVVLGFGHPVNLHILMALARSGVPVVVSERSDPRFRSLSWRWRLLRRLYYPGAAKVVLAAAEALDWARAMRPTWDVRAVDNPVWPPHEPQELEQCPAPAWLRPPCVVALGRLAPEKGFDLLLRAFAPLAQEFPDWRLYIVGEGGERPRLEGMVRELGLEDRALLPGAVFPAWGVLRRAQVFALSSRVEGFPNALLEAMARGVACLAVDCPSGPGRIVRHERDGLLAPYGDPNAVTASMTAGLRRLLADPDLRQRLGARAPDVLERFSVARILPLWQEIIEQALTRKRGDAMARHETGRTKPEA